MDTITGLSGLYFIADDNGETYSTGQVIAAVGPNAYLIRHDGLRNKLPMQIATVPAMASWEFFRTREEMEAWLTLLNGEPEGPRIVTFPKK